MEPKKPFKFNGYVFRVPDNSGQTKLEDLAGMLQELELQMMTQDRNFPEAQEALAKIMSK